MEFWDKALGVVIGFVLFIVIGFVIVLLVFTVKGMFDEDSLAQRYLSDFADVVDYCGERSSNTTYSLANGGDFAVGHFLDCLSRNNVVFALNGDTVKVNTP